MRARAPGKIVLSGAYAVLSGAPGLVLSVDRYAVADTSREPSFVTEEVRAALGARRPPWVDASELREAGQKLGLGSSAAILVASLAALELDTEPGLSPKELAGRVFPDALVAHAKAQGGGSGIDVAASAYGGVLHVTRQDGALAVRPVELPEGIDIRVLSLGRAASTRELLARVQALSQLDAALYESCFRAQVEASERALLAVDAGDAHALISALSAQTRALSALGTAAGAQIVTREILELQHAADSRGAAALPAGAGGGDVALWVSLDSGVPPPHIPGIQELSLRWGVPGVHGLG